MDIISILTNGSNTFSVGVYFFILFIALSESIPMFGFFIPGQVVAVTAGLLAKVGSLDILTVLIVLFVGAVAGDVIGYFLGEKYGESFIAKYGKYFWLKKENFDKTRELICAHPGKTIIIGRFNSVTRAFTPFTAGSVKIPFSKFIFFDILGGISWAVTFSMLGYIFGYNYKVIADYFGEFVIIAITIGALIVYLYKKINKKRRIFHRRHLYVLFINLFSLYVFFKMLENFVDQKILIHWDNWLSNYVITLWNPFLNVLMIIITNLGSTLVLSVLSIALLIFFVSKNKWRYSALLIIAMVGGKAIEIAFKYIIARDRPLGSLVETTGYSFPSGHATMAIIFFSILAYYFKNHIYNKNLKYILISINIFLILSIGFSRIYLHAHWLTDVIGGFSLGMFWLTLLILALEAITTIFKEKVMEIKSILNKEKSL
ncbi:MAG: bifunctional DedA family/phosphatase PAP2 family protein [Candidatus Moranbacteria bacterium]|jgi:undecaprenyl-diphosphatase|nr:bifunctional DedA family/phosphatase PAP2 family protein [Candidatus Moranbacteria bacterium]